MCCPNPRYATAPLVNGVRCLSDLARPLTSHVRLTMQVVSRWTGIPVDRLQQTEVEKLLHLKEELHKRVVGQQRAVAAVADAVLRSRAGLASRSRGSSFLFLVSTLHPPLVNESTSAYLIPRMPGLP